MIHSISDETIILINKKVFLWEAATGKFELFEGHDSGCTNVDFSYYIVLQIIDLG